ncbi:MAG: hypothetical protein R3348_02780 [Xanthomonadales bacterium]|nr:hypothetical protein [Xanthomonadales bacterium]
MNRIQKISQDVLSQKLKLQMGLDPSVDIELPQLQDMWAQLQRERNQELAHSFVPEWHDRAA